MEDILIALLFIYPGALIEAIRRRNDHFSYEESGLPDAAKAAVYFCWSLAVTILSVATMKLLGLMHGATVAAILEELGVVVNALIYISISLLYSNAIAFIYIRYQALQKKGKDGLYRTRATNPWRAFVYDKTYDEIRTHAILRVRSGDIEYAGFIQNLPDDFTDGILLENSDYVQTQLQKEKEANDEATELIGLPWLVYVDPDTGMFVEIYNGKKLHQKLYSGS